MNWPVQWVQRTGKKQNTEFAGFRFLQRWQNVHYGDLLQGKAKDRPTDSLGRTTNRDYKGLKPKRGNNSIALGYSLARMVAYRILQHVCLSICLLNRSSSLPVYECITLCTKCSVILDLTTVGHLSSHCCLTLSYRYGLRYFKVLAYLQQCCTKYINWSSTTS